MIKVNLLDFPFNQVGNTKGSIAFPSLIMKAIEMVLINYEKQDELK